MDLQSSDDGAATSPLQYTIKVIKAMVDFLKFYYGFMESKCDFWPFDPICWVRFQPSVCVLWNVDLFQRGRDVRLQSLKSQLGEPNVRFMCLPSPLLFLFHSGTLWQCFAFKLYLPNIYSAYLSLAFCHWSFHFITLRFNYCYIIDNLNKSSEMVLFFSFFF